MNGRNGTDPLDGRRAAFGGRDDDPADGKRATFVDSAASPGSRPQFADPVADLGSRPTLANPAVIPDVAGDRVDGVRRIAVLRAGGLGDLVFALPAFDALAAAYPEATIDLLGNAWQGELLGRRPSPVRRVVALPPLPGITAHQGAPADNAAIEATCEELRAEGYDLAIQLHGGGRHSNPFIRRLGARVTAGLATPDAEPLDRVVPYVYYQGEVARALEVVGVVGAAPVRLEPRLLVTDRDHAEAKAALAAAAGARSEADAARAAAGDGVISHPYAATQPLVVLNPGAGDARRRWPPESFAAVGEAMARLGATVVVSGSAAERDLAAAVTRRIAAPTGDVSGRLSVSGLAGLLARSRVVVSNDSGPLHLAAAVGTRTVGIYWCGNLINAGPFTRTRHRPAISWQLACPTCGLDCTRFRCPHSDSFVAAVTVDEVVQAATALLEEARGERGGQSASAREARAVPAGAP